MKKVKILNLEEFLIRRGLEYPVVIGPRWEEDTKGKPSDDRFYVLNSAAEQVQYIRSVWRKGEFSSGVQSAIDEYDRHEINIRYSHDMDSVKKSILLEGLKAYRAYVIREKRTHGDNVTSTKLSDNFKKLIKTLGVDAK